ncbi:unnamed protein product [Wickerhamomyces anomalus]
MILVPLRFFWSKKPIVSSHEDDNRPILQILVFDFSSVNQIDATGVQALVDLRKAINKYADREVEFHFAGILSPWIKKALISAQFGIERNDAKVNNNYVDIVQDEEAVYGYNAAVTTDTPYFHLDLPSFDNYED